MENEDKKSDEEKKKDVSIKGVSRELYQKMISLAKSTGKNVGEITDDAYRSFLSTVEDIKHSARNSFEKQKDDVNYVENIKYLTVDSKTLLEFGNKVSFQNMDELVFEGVTNEQFTSKIESIRNVKRLVIPSQVSKATAILRCTYVDQIEQK